MTIVFDPFRVGWGNWWLLPGVLRRAKLSNAFGVVLVAMEWPDLREGLATNIETRAETWRESQFTFLGHACFTNFIATPFMQ
jgi:hypothetical protein